jgi:4'-phosphopantetheinyl transferase
MVPARTVLPVDEVHVWRASLDQPPPVVDRLAGLLASDEAQRAARFRFARDRDRYIVGRGLLRTLLSRYVGRLPDELRFTYGAFEKPALAGGGPHFNLSHSGPLALLAVSGGAEVGIDVEIDDADFAKERIAERFFSKAEVLELRSLPEEVQPHAFLACWTRKEAFIKARGDGLSLPLDSFDVSLAPEHPAALRRTGWSAAEPAQWWLHDLSDATRGYIAAVAMRSAPQRIVNRDVSVTSIADPSFEQGAR